LVFIGRSQRALPPPPVEDNYKGAVYLFIFFWDLSFLSNRLQQYIQEKQEIREHLEGVYRIYSGSGLEIRMNSKITGTFFSNDTSMITFA